MAYLPVGLARAASADPPKALGWTITPPPTPSAFDRSASFAEGALLSVNLGDDADTTGAVYGQIAGAYYGEEGIPAHWREKIVQRELIESMADRLLELATVLSSA